MKRTLLILSIAIAALLAGSLTYQAGKNTQQTRIDFVLLDLDDQSRSAAEFDGQLVLLNFWAPWCAPCRAEIPLLNELQATYGKRGLQILGPAVDQREAVEQFQTDTPINYPVLLGMPDILHLQDAYGDQRLPYSVLIGRQGQVIFRQAGELQKNQITALIEQHL